MDTDYNYPYGTVCSILGSKIWVLNSSYVVLRHNNIGKLVKVTMDGLGGPYSAENRWPLGTKSSGVEIAGRQTKLRTSTNKMNG